MKTHTMLSAILLMICSLYSGVNWARHGYSSFGFSFGVPLYSYPYYRDPFYRDPFYYPYYYPPTVITVPVTPPVYIQQSPPAAQQYPSGYWYYCNNPEGYYPYIKECPRGWQQVEPIPSSPR
ncbi:MAG: hypothetical protein Q7T96_18845 [Methylobacter sp.]|nr:hypothetical protein [Methylobacter sp.]